MRAKPGPKLKAGERYASGALKPNCSGPAPVAIKRAIEAALRGAGDPRWGSTIGRLRLEGVLTDRQLGAAESYGRLRGKFDRAMGMPRRSNITITLTNPTVVLEGTSNPGYVVFLNESVTSPNRKSPFAVFVDPQGHPMPAVASIGYRIDFKDLTRHKQLWPSTPTDLKKP